MQDRRAKIWSLIKENLIIAPAVIMSALFLIGYWQLEARKVSLVHPGPAYAAAGLAAIVLITGLAINLLHQQNSALKASIQEKDPGRLPRITGLEFLVERWQQFKPKEYEREILNEQISIALSVARLHYSSADEVRFIRYFPGTKLKSGVFLLQTSRPNCKPTVLKFDSLTNIAREQACYEHCVKEYLAYTPGEPWIPRQQNGFVENHPWGAIAYSFVGAGANPDDLDRLQTFDKYYLEHSEIQIEKALDNIFTAMEQ